MIINFNTNSMKNKLKILTLLVLGTFLLPNCQKDPDLNWPDLKKGIIPVVEKDETKNLVIFDNNIAGFAGGVTVDLFYKDKPKSMSLMVSLNDDPDITATAIADITTVPVSYNFTIANLVDLLPGLDNLSEIVSGDYFRFYCDITLEDGTLVRGNDTLYTAHSAGIANLPGSSSNVIFNVACGYEPSLAGGVYNAVSAAWAVNGDVTITVDPVDQYKVYVAGLETIDGLVEDKGPLVMHIDPATFAVTVDKTVLASLVTWANPPYHNIAYAGSGTYNTCTGTYDMTYIISVDEGNFGSFKFTLTRK